MRFFRHKMAVVEPRRPDLHRARRDLREPGRALRLRRDRPRQHQPDDRSRHAATLEGWHIFGTDQLGRDYLSRVIYGIRTSLWVALFVAILATLIGTAIGALAGYYGGRSDNLLMRFTDLILTLPGLAVLLTAAVYFGSNDSEVSSGRSGPIRSR